MREEWIDPEQAHVAEYFATTVQESARRRGITLCHICHGVGAIVMVNPATKEPFSVPCSRCGM